MPNFYVSVPNRHFVTQPQLIRWRSRYRGPRESFKINSEMKALQYDIAKIYQKVNSLILLSENTQLVLKNGSSFENTYFTSEDVYGHSTMGELTDTADEFYEGTMGDQQELPLSIEGSTALFARIEAMRSRFRRTKTLGG